MTVLPSDSIQGNILKSFGRKHARFLFLRFDPAAAVERVRLSKILRTYVTSACRQSEITRKWKDGAGSEGVGMFGLSWTGYENLGIRSVAPNNPAVGLDVLQKGMGDPVYRPGSDEFWEPEYSKRLDGFLLLADDEGGRLEEIEGRAKQDLDGLASVAKTEPAQRLPADSETGEGEVEAFGFRDQISRAVDPTIVFTPENRREPFVGGFGCFAAFMKLEQNVEKFNRQSRELSELFHKVHAFVSPEDVAARMIGRYRTGEPLVPRGETLDDFNFTNDPQGEACPFQAHIRVMNDRNGQERIPIVRRGMSYSVAPDNGDATQPSTGLLFLSFHRSLLDFVILMSRALHRRDPILANSSMWGEQSDESDRTHCTHGFKAQRWQAKGREVCYPFADVTTLKGGEFFHIPSMDFLRDLGAIKGDENVTDPVPPTTY